MVDTQKFVVDLRKFVMCGADEMEGFVGGCTMDDLRDDERYFPSPPDAYDIKWFVSRERSEVDDGEARYALAIHSDRKFVLDIDKYNEKLDNDEEMDGSWELAQ